jgi:AcrR family transcriptional regulator
VGPELEWVHPPRQARSQQTLERLLEAAEELLSERGPDGFTVQEVARRAGSSVGSFYSRFPDKEALLRCLFQRFYEQATATIDAALAPGRWEGTPAPDLVGSAMAFLVRTCRDKRQLILALTVRAVKDPALGSYGVRIGQRMALRVAELLHARREPLRHPDPDQAIMFLIWLVLSALDARAIGSAHGAEVIPDWQVAEELTRLAVTYLGLEADGGDARSASGPTAV